MTITFKDRYFTIDGKIRGKKLNLIMKVFQRKHINTRTIPVTVPILNKHLPVIVTCDCFNDKNCSFEEECKHTELGHLFEHIMLEYLCMAKIADGKNEAIYEGITSWNWLKEKEGTFNIEITSGLKDEKFIKKALNQSTDLLSKILS